MTDEQRKILDRHLAALEDDARAMDATAELFRPEFDACWERDADGRMGQTLNGERALQLRDIVLTGASNAAYNRKLADAIRALAADEKPAWPATYQETFDAIAAAVTVQGSSISISVKAFYRALAYPDPTPSLALPASAIEGGTEP